MEGVYEGLVNMIVKKFSLFYEMFSEESEDGEEEYEEEILINI